MAIEKEKIVSKLNEKGVDAKFAEGASFETEEDLEKWVDNIKTLSDKPKPIEEYTADELEALLKDPQPKAKGLQALADKIRAAKKKEEEENTKKTKEVEIPEEIKSKLSELDTLKSEWEAAKKEQEESKKTKTFEDLFSKHANGLDEDDKKYVKATLNPNSSDEDIKKAVANYKSMMAKRGFKGFGADTPNKKDQQDKDDDLEKSIKRMLDKKNKK